MPGHWMGLVVSCFLLLAHSGEGHPGCTHQSTSLCCLTPNPSTAGALQPGTEEELELGYCKACTISWLV